MAVVRTAALSDPASGSVRAKEVTIWPEAIAGQPFGFLFVGTEHHQALRADADIGAERRAERRAGAAELDHHQALLFHGEV